MRWMADEIKSKCELTGQEMYFLERAGYFVRRACLNIPIEARFSPDSISLEFALELFARPEISFAERELFRNARALQVLYRFSNALSGEITKTLYRVHPPNDAYYEAVDIIVVLTDNLKLEAISGSHTDKSSEIVAKGNRILMEPVWTALSLSKGDVLFADSKLSVRKRPAADADEAFVLLQLGSIPPSWGKLHAPPNTEIPESILSFFTDR